MKSKTLKGYVKSSWLNEFRYARGQLGRPRKLSTPAVFSRPLKLLQATVRITITIEEEGPRNLKEFYKENDGF